MPCRSDYMEPTPAEHKATRKVNDQFKALADELTHSLDIIREHILNPSVKTEANWIKHVTKDYQSRYDAAKAATKGLYVRADDTLIDIVDALLADWEKYRVVTSKDNLSSPALRKLTNEQKKHREEDKRRLAQTFAQMGNWTMLEKVVTVDTRFPLEPQLGYDPDKF